MRPMAYRLLPSLAQIGSGARVSFIVKKESLVESVDQYQLAQAIGVEAFEGVEFLDATAFSKGKGFQGVIKRHNFAGGPASHGSGFHRHG